MAASRKQRHGHRSPKRPRQQPQGAPAAAAAPEQACAAPDDKLTSADGRTAQPQKEKAAAGTGACKPSHDAEAAAGKKEEAVLSSGSAHGVDLSDASRGACSRASGSVSKRRHSLADVRRAIAAQAHPRLATWSAFP